MPAELREKFIAATGASLVEGYGLTESSGVVATNPYDGPVKAGTIGQPIPATHIRLLDKEDPDQDAPAGEPGGSEEHTSELQSLMRISYAVFCLKKKKNS